MGARPEGIFPRADPRLGGAGRGGHRIPAGRGGRVRRGDLHQQRPHDRLRPGHRGGGGAAVRQAGKALRRQAGRPVSVVRSPVRLPGGEGSGFVPLRLPGGTPSPPGHEGRKRGGSLPLPARVAKQGDGAGGAISRAGRKPMTLVPGSGGRSINDLEWTGDTLLLLNQRVLPLRESVTRITDSSGVAHAIRTMVARGAPAIGVTAAFGLVLAVRDANRKRRSWREAFRSAAEELRGTRPTAVNLFWAIDRMRRGAGGLPDEPEGAAYHLEREAVAIFDEDIAANRKLGARGAKLLRSGAVLTHCNAGALATAGYGTALGIVRAAVAAGKKIHRS